MKFQYQLAILALFLCIAFRTSAQTPQEINYQFVVRTNTGTVEANANVGVQLRIYEPDINGTIVYEEEHNVTTNSFGLASIRIGTGTTTGDLSNVNWNSGSFELETSVDFNGGANYTVMGSSPLVSVPYALHAETVSNDMVFDGDSSMTNELQMLSISNDTIYLTNGGSVSLPAGFDGDFNSLTNVPAGLNDGDDDTQLTEAQVDAFADNNGYLTTEVDGSITNEIQTLSISGNSISLSNSGGTVTLPAEVDGSITNELQTLSISGNDISLSNSGGTVTLPAEVDGSITNEIQTLSISGSDLSLSNGGGTVTLPSGGGGGDEIADVDDDTKVQVEETNDDDVIRFDVGGAEVWRMDGNALEEANEWENICIGIDAGDALMPGATDNILIGSLTGTNVTTGDFNTVVGSETFDAATTGDFNTFIGYNVGHNLTTANLNTAVGVFALYDITTGQDNVAYGRGALSNVTSGTHNLGVGRDAGLKVNVGSNNVFIGNNAGADTPVNISDKLYIDNTNTNDPLIYGDFALDVLTINGDLKVDGDLTPVANNAHNLGSTSLKWSAVYANNGTIQTSDARLKKNVQPLNYGLETVLSMRAVSYNWKDTTQTEDKIGFIAQELEVLVPEVVNIGSDSAQTRGVNYAELVPVLVKAIQELEAKNRELAQINQQQEEKFEALETKLEALTEAINTSQNLIVEFK